MDNPVCDRKVELVLTDTDGEMTKAIMLSQQEINRILDGLGIVSLATLPYQTDAVIAKILEAKKWLK